MTVLGWTPPALANSPVPGDWVRSAACRQLDLPLQVRAALFTPKDGPSAEKPKRICAGCPVVTDCLDYALNLNEELYGVWGGMSQTQRRRIREDRWAGRTS